MEPRVLLIEDAPEYREFMAESLSGHGFDVCWAEDGVEALEKIREHAPDAVICDVVMPRMSGFRLLEDIRRQHAELPFILTSSWDSTTARAHARELGATDFVPKELDTQRLLESLRRCVPKKRRVTIPPPPQAPLAQWRLGFANRPEISLGEISRQLYLPLRILPQSDRIQVAQLIQQTIQITICLGNLEASPKRWTGGPWTPAMRRRAKALPFRDRKASMLVSAFPRELRLAFTDQGPGFDYRAVEESHLVPLCGRLGELSFRREGQCFEFSQELPEPIKSSTFHCVGRI